MKLSPTGDFAGSNAIEASVSDDNNTNRLVENTLLIVLLSNDHNLFLNENPGAKFFCFPDNQIALAG